MAQAKGIKGSIKKANDFVSTDLWRVRLHELPKHKSFFLTLLRIIVLTARGFNKDKCAIRASALTFFTLLSIVPIFAVLFGIARGFGLDTTLETEILNKFAAQEPTVTRIVVFAHNLLEQTRSTTITGIGVVLLFWSVIKVLGQAEHAFNDIWEVSTHRNLKRRFTNYLSIMLISPILLIIAGSATILITGYVTRLGEADMLRHTIGPVMIFSLKLIPYLITWLVFTFIYVIVPYTSVRIVPALIAGVIAGTIYQVVQWAYITFQIFLAQYNAIYGSFAALPLFLVWLQTSWLIVLFGAEMSFSIQNVETYELEPDSINASTRFRRLISLLMMRLIAKNFSTGNVPYTAAVMAQTLKLPIRLTRQTLDELTGAGILISYTPDEEKEFSYTPAVDINKLTISYVLNALDSKGSDGIKVSGGEEISTLTGALGEFDSLVSKSPSNALLKDI